MSIESKGYVASVKDIEALVLSRCDAGTYISDSRTTYLRALIATTQDKLGINPKGVRTNAVADREVLQAHALALEETHTVFYEAVQRAAKQASVASDDVRPKADIVASRIVFARSAYSTVRSWILRGEHPLNAIVASKATKRGLADATPKRAVSDKPKTFKPDKVMKLGKDMLETIVVAAKEDKDAAVAALHDLINLLSHGFDDLGHNANELRSVVDHTATGVLQITKRAPRSAIRKAA